jgi:hypothetical protein
VALERYGTEDIHFTLREIKNLTRKEIKNPCYSNHEMNVFTSKMFISRMKDFATHKSCLQDLPEWAEDEGPKDRTTCARVIAPITTVSFNNFKTRKGMSNHPPSDKRRSKNQPLRDGFGKKS